MILDTMTPPKVATSLTDAIEELEQTVRTFFQQDALSLTVFGAATTKAFQPEVHSARSVLVVSRVELSAMRRLAEGGEKLGRLPLAAPLVMTPEYIRQSLDTFPLEFLEISQRHVTVFGMDYFDHLEFHERELRLQCERELKVAAITLRQGLLASMGKEHFIEQLERELGEGLLRVLRGMLWLKGKREAEPGATVIQRMEEHMSGPMMGIRAALDNENPAGWREFEMLYADVDALGKAVNDW